MINKEGFFRDCFLSLEYYQDKDKAKEYIFNEFKSDYTIEEMEIGFTEAYQYWNSLEVK
jgi:hypothetical protein